MPDEERGIREEYHMANDGETFAQMPACEPYRFTLDHTHTPHLRLRIHTHRASTIIVDCIYIVSYQSVIRSTTGGTLSVPLCSYYTSQNGMTIEMTKVKPFQLFPVHDIPERTEG